MSKNTISASATALPDRRLFLTAAPAVAIMGALATPAHANQHQHDDEFRRLSAEYDEALADHRRIRAEFEPMETEFDSKVLDYYRRFSTTSMERFWELRKAMGIDEAGKRIDDALLRIDDINKQIRALPTLSVYAIAVKLKVLHFDIGMGEPETDDLEEMDWDQACYVRLLREVEALAAGAVAPTSA